MFIYNFEYGVVQLEATGDMHYKVWYLLSGCIIKTYSDQCALMNICSAMIGSTRPSRGQRIVLIRLTQHICQLKARRLLAFKNEIPRFD
jgi:hypothetical protein